MPHKPEATSLFSRRDAVWFALAWALLCGRLLYQITYFPAFLWGEEARALDGAEFIQATAAYKGSWLQAILLAAPEYNKGYTWFVLPFFHAWGWDPRISMVMSAVFVGLWGAYLFHTYRKANDKTSSLWSFVLIASFALLAVCVRRYKWHTMAYPGVISVYLFFLPEIRRDLARRTALIVRAVAIVFFGTASFFYFGNIIYTVPFFVLLVYFAILDRKRFALTFAIVFLVGVIGLQLLAYRMDDVWAFDLNGSVKRILGAFTAEQFKDRWETVRHFCSAYLSWPYTVLLVTGLASSAVQIVRGQRFALVNTVFFFWLFGMQFIMWGINNCDCLNWSMVPLLAMLLTGVETWREAIERFVPKGGLVFAALALGVAVSEIHYYPTVNRAVQQQTTIDPENTATQAALVLRSIMEDTTSDTQYFLPDPSLQAKDGGFDYLTNLKRVDYKQAWARVVLFKHEDDLRAKLAAVPPGKKAVAFLGIYENKRLDDSAAPVNAPLLGIKPERFTPYKDIYRTEIPSRRYQLTAPGPSAP